MCQPTLCGPHEIAHGTVVRHLCINVEYSFEGQIKNICMKGERVPTFKKAKRERRLPRLRLNQSRRSEDSLSTKISSQHNLRQDIPKELCPPLRQNCRPPGADRSPGSHQACSRWATIHLFSDLWKEPTHHLLRGLAAAPCHVRPESILVVFARCRVRKRCDLRSKLPSSSSRRSRCSTEARQSRSGQTLIRSQTMRQILPSSGPPDIDGAILPKALVVEAVHLQRRPCGEKAESL